MFIKHIALAVFVAFVWGVNFSIIKIGLDYFPPLLLSAFRFLLVAVPAVFFVSRPNVCFRDILALGLLLGVIKFSFLFIGMDMGVSAGIASVALQSQIFFTIVLAAVLVHERPTSLQIIGIVIGFIGITLLGIVSSETSFDLLAAGFVVLAGAAWAFANMIMKRLGAENAFKVIVWMSLVPPIPLFIASYIFEPHDRIISALTEFDFYGFSALIYLAVCSTLLAYTIWTRLLAVYPTTLVAPFTLFVPVFGVLSGAVLLNEEFTLQIALASALVLAGLAIANFGSLVLTQITRLLAICRNNTY